MEFNADPKFLNDIADSTRSAAKQLCIDAKLDPGQTVIIGCSTSEITGNHIGTASSTEIGSAVFSALHSVFSERGINISAQCCEHLNRAIIIEREAAAGLEIVNVVPTPKAGGAFAAAAYAGFRDPVAVEWIRADAGLDIGSTLIGMHLKPVAIPLRLEVSKIGEAIVTAARTRPKLIGGDRAVYDESLL